jgi:ankyrin repeat protein
MRHLLYIVITLAVMSFYNVKAQEGDTLDSRPTIDEHLIFAADAGDTVLVNKLISLGADVDAVTSEGVTPLMYATQNGNLSMMRLLIRCGANPDLKPLNGLTALITAIRNRQIDLAEFLIRSGAGVDLADNEKMTPLMHAIVADTFYLPDMLLYYNAMVDPVRRDGADALMLASGLGRYEIAEELIGLGTGVNNMDKSGRTPLHYAASASNTDVMKLLIGEGAIVEARTASGYTPLSLAVAKNNFAVARLLIESGANVNTRISASLNPLALADENGYDSLYTMLRNNGAKIILWPWFNQVSFGGSFAFTSEDMQTGVHLGYSDIKYNLWTSIGYEFRPKAIRILEPAKGDNYYQYWERRHFISFSLDKAFLFPRKNSKVKGGLAAGFQESMTFGSYRGSGSGPETQLVFSPHAGAVLQYQRLRMRFNYEFMDLHLMDMSKNWCSISVELLFNRKKGKLKYNSISGT